MDELSDADRIHVNLLDREPELRVLVRLYDATLGELAAGGVSSTALIEQTKSRKSSVSRAITGSLRCDPPLIVMSVDEVGTSERVRYRLTPESVLGLRWLTGRPPRLEPHDQERKLAVTGSAPSAFPGDYDYVARAPGSIFLSGDYAVLCGRKAVLLPLPLFVEVGLKLVATGPGSRSQPSVEIKSGSPSPNASYEELASGFPRVKTIQRVGADSKVDVSTGKVTRVASDLLRESLELGLKSRPHPWTRVVGARITLTSQIPMGCGLGSSGALSAAVALILDEIRNPGMDFSRKEFREGIVTSDSFGDRAKRVLLEAIRIEEAIQGASSGAGPFASLFGSVTFGPIRYEMVDMKRVENADIGKFPPILDWKAVRAEELTQLQAKAWTEHFAVAAVYTGLPRWGGGEITKRSRVERLRGEGADERLRDFDYCTDKFWENTLVADWSDVVAATILYKSYEAGHLKLMEDTDQGEEERQVRKEERGIRSLCGYFIGMDLGAKYTGAGGGGDLIVCGRAEDVRRALIPNYYPVHFRSYDSPPGTMAGLSHSGIEFARPSTATKH